MPNLIYRRMRLADVRAVVVVHLRAFPGFFFAFLGPAFLRVLYECILDSPLGIFYGCEDNGRLLGFVAGTDQPAAFYRCIIRRRWLRFCIAVIVPILKKPAIIPHLLRALSMPQQADPGEGCGTLISIAVLPETQGKGVGQKLVDAFLVEAARRGLKQVNLTTDKQDNNATNRFYQRYGFHLHRSYITPEGREINEYRIDLPVKC